MDTKENLIYIDDLTGLFNRRHLFSQLPRELQIAKTQEYNLWVFMLDIDNFKMINDTYGHLCGDEVIKDVAGILQGNIKSEDIKIRYAGDEFTLILSKLETKDVINVAQRLVTKVGAHHFKEKHSNKEIKLTISMGIAGYPRDSSDATELINLADKALYISKQKGRNCVSTALEITADLFWKKDMLERFPCPVFIERENEFLILKDALASAYESGARMILFSGELGIGKTRLLNEFERFILSQHAVCLSTRGVDKFISQPYHILAEALDRYLYGLDKLPKEFLEDISELERVVLERFLPILKDAAGVSSVDEGALAEKDYLSTALVKFLINISKSALLCILFDDLHYADAQSLGIILSVIQQHKESRVLVISTFSPRDLNVPDIGVCPLAEVVNTEVFQRHSQTLNLTNLTRGGVSVMISNIFLNIPLTDEFSDLIYKITKGNPLFVEELLKYLGEKEYIFYQNGKWMQKEISEADLPGSIEETIKARIADLNAETKEMIAKAAVIGEDFQVDLLQKMDSEDRGYILDLIESAKKIGLIYERGVAGKDEFSFVTNEIRNILFKAVGGERTKNLYSRLGQVQEKLYPDKLNSIAGELYYNFKKAEDWVRAEQYAKIVKEGRGFFYDRTMKYVRSLLGEAVEGKAIQPLSKRTWAVMPELIRCIYIASVDHVLYPPQNKVRVQSVEELNKKIAIVLSEVNILSIACVESAIIINDKKVGKELPPFFANAFITLLNNLNIESIVFKKGLDHRELSAFIEMISIPEQEEGFAELLEKANIKHIKINEISYDILKKKSKEKEGLEEIMLIDYLLGKLPADEKKADFASTISTHAEEIARTLEKLGEEASKKSGKDKETAKAEIMAKSIQKIGTQFFERDKDNWRKYKEGLAKTLLSMEPNLRANILCSETEEKIDIIKELSRELPDDAVVDVLTTQYLQKDTDIEKMRRLAQRFLSNASRKEKLTSVLKEKFKQAGANEEELSFIFEEKPWGDISAVEKANKILTLPIERFVKILPAVKIGPLIQELSSQDETLTETVIERLFSILEDKYVDSQNLVDYFKGILDIFIQNSPNGLLPKFIQRLIKTCLNREEFLPFFISVINLYLGKITQIFLESEQFTLIKETIQIYTRDEKTNKEQLKLLETVTAKIVEEFVRRVDLSLEWAGLTEILILLKDQATKLLIEAALFEEKVPEGKYFEAYLRRRIIGKILEQASKEKVLALLNEKVADSRPYMIKDLIELIGAMEDEEIIKILEVPLRHPENFIRRKTIFALRKKKGKESVRLLAQALKDEDINIRKEALRILKERQDVFAQQVIKECAQDKYLPEDIRREL